MKKYQLIFLTLTLSLFVILTACSPSEPPSETFIDNQKRVLDKAKQVEKIGLQHKSDIDEIVKNAEHN